MVGFFYSLGQVLAAALLFCSAVRGYPQLQDEFKEREIALRQVKESYDYIVVGGGQSALVVANRLSEDLHSTVLVVEYGCFDNDIEVLQPQSAINYPKKDLYNLTSGPQRGLRGSRQSVYAACVIGGGSTINGMMLNRGATDDYDNWERLDNTGWGWNGLLPYFVKSTMFQAPSPTLQKEFNITWNESSYGLDGQIHVSYAPFQWPGIKIQYQGLVETGCIPQLDGADGNAFGVFWYTSAVNNTTVTRSYARTGYYDPIKNHRNLQVLTGTRVNEVLFDRNKHATSVRLQPRDSEDGSVSVVNANKEIILTAGSLHSPQILQRSGIGPADLLRAAGIDVLVDLPGVGSNLQDHPVAGVSFQYPLSQTTGNTAGLMPLKPVSPDGWQKIVTAYESQDVKQYLPLIYTTEQIAGYEIQRKLLADSMTRMDNAVLEFPILAKGPGHMLLTKEVSRGTILLNTSDIYADPILDYGTFTNPVDVAIQAENYKFVRRFHQTPSMQTLGPVEQSPGANITTDEALQAQARNSTSSTTAHISGTCSMMPRNLGGVVNSELLVYGVTGLSVADSSIQPLIPGAHICATVYAVAEKAADLIKARHKSLMLGWR